MRVLIYETSHDRAKLIEELLKDYRYKTYTEITNGKMPSVSKIQAVRPSLIIMNVGVRTHLELLEKIKSMPKYAHIPVILISNFNSQEILKKINHMSNVDYLIEPFKLKNFRHMVERWVNFRSLYVK